MPSRSVSDSEIKISKKLNSIIESVSAIFYILTVPQEIGLIGSIEINSALIAILNVAVSESFNFTAYIEKEKAIDSYIDRDIDFTKYICIEKSINLELL